MTSTPTYPEDIFQTACGVVMEAKSLKSILRHKDVVDAIAAALLAERERHQWQPISSAPRDGTIVDLLTLGGTVAHDEWWIEEDGESFWSCDYDDKFVTHWRPVMPLPAAIRNQTGEQP